MTNGGQPTAHTELRDAALSYDLTDVEVAAIRRYQAHDGTHEQLNTLLRGRAAQPSEVRRLRPVLRGLDSILNRASLPVDVTVYKGVREIDALIAADAALPLAVAQHAYLSTTLERRVVKEFMGTARGAAILKIKAKRGAPALWLPPVGDPRYEYESELLFRRGSIVTFRDRRVEGRTLVFSCEVDW